MFDESRLTSEMAWQPAQRTRPPACSRPDRHRRLQAGQGTRPGCTREVSSSSTVPSSSLTAEETAAKTSWANAMQFSKRSAGSLAKPREWRRTAARNARDQLRQAPAARPSSG